MFDAIDCAYYSRLAQEALEKANYSFDATTRQRHLDLAREYQDKVEGLKSHIRA